MKIIIGKKALREQATSEWNVVKKCNDILKVKETGIRDRIKTLDARIESELEKGKLSNDEAIKLECARKVRRDRKQRKIFDKDYQNYSGVEDALCTLLAYIEVFYNHEYYRFIVRKIPEKKLATMINSAAGIEKLYALINDLADEFNTECAKKNLVQEAQTAIERKRQIAEDNWDEISGTVDDDLYDIIKKEMQSTEQNDIPAVSVVEANNNNNVN